MDIQMKQKHIKIALGQEQADLVLKNVNVVNVFSREINQNDVAVSDGYIVGIGSYQGMKEIDLSGKYLCPGFIDAHCHIESSLVTPQRFASEIIHCGTTTVIADPHEVANVAGTEGIEYILNASENTDVDIYLMLPSCVPSSQFETGGSVLTSHELAIFAEHPKVLGLGEVMDVTGIFTGKEDLLKKIRLFKKQKTIDGHAPSVTGKQLQAYKCAGIDTDHESASFEEALEKVRCGISVLIREGSAAKNLQPIVEGIVKHKLPTHNMAFCSDDKTIHSIRRDGHINGSIAKAIKLGLDPAEAIAMGTINTAKIYGLHDIGAIAPGYRADFVIIDDLHAMRIESVYKNGNKIAPQKAPVTSRQSCANDRLKHTVNIKPVTIDMLAYETAQYSPVITIIPKDILTKKSVEKVPLENGLFVADQNYSKCLVIERHRQTGHMGKGIIKGYGITGAIASTISHDCHNLVIIGRNDQDMLCAIEEVVRIGGGFAIARGGKILKSISLPICGLMTDDNQIDIDQEIDDFIAIAHANGVSKEIDPLVNLAFMALPVIPEIRITDLGLFDVIEGKFI